MRHQPRYDPRDTRRKPLAHHHTVRLICQFFAQILIGGNTMYKLLNNLLFHEMGNPFSSSSQTNTSTFATVIQENTCVNDHLYNALRVPFRACNTSPESIRL